MDTRARYRTMEVREDAADGCVVFVPYEDALDRAVRFVDSFPDWHCDCGTLNAGQEFACGYCGRVREDIDACE